MSEISVEGLPASGVPFRVGDVLSTTFTVFGSKPGSFLLLTLVPLLPVLVLNLLTPGGPQLVETTAETAATLSTLSGVLDFVLGVAAQAMTLHAAFQQMAGRRVSIARSLGVGFGRLLPVCGVAILAVLFTLVAAVLLIVPGIIAFCALYVAGPVCVIENPGILASIDRSARLTRGSRWQIFGLLALVSIIGFIPGFVLAMLVDLGSVWGKLLNFGWQAVATSFGAVLAVVAYRDLRVAKEGADVDHLADVFD